MQMRHTQCVHTIIIQDGPRKKKKKPTAESTNMIKAKKNLLDHTHKRGRNTRKFAKDRKRNDPSETE